ncbi:TonB-dependent receptor domain-containing protein [Massilia scottii]|uniref:TonB-dependent receptor domain-containing protein n=1 Tax=Massilia scottii TaxID=3057166 RepID=UPI002796812B|nr:TonB-dependent receptor [Massilia sp. CCM 9029]MDQ1834432.1 TonB-dependent receptor [Massilia sp. CCM 9029]
MITSTPMPARASARRPASAPLSRVLGTTLNATLLAVIGTGAAHAQSLRAPQQLSGIVVTQAREKTPDALQGSVVVISAEELARRNAGDMSAIARYEPLVAVPAAFSGSGSVWDGAGNTGFNIRGVEGNRVSLDIDGIALPDAAPKPDGTAMNTFGIGRDYFDPAMFREVRIGSGAGAAAAGTPGLAGSVAFVTKSPGDYLSDGKRSYLAYALGYSDANNSRSHSLTGAARMGALDALAVAVHRSGKELENKGSVPANPDDWDSNALLAKFQWTPMQGQRIGLTLDGYERDNARSYVNKTSGLYPNGVLQDSRTKRTRVSLEHRMSGATHGLFDTLESRVYVQDASVDDRTRARYITGNQPYLRNIDTGYFNKSAGAGGDATLKLGHSLSVAYGAAYEQSETRRPWLEDRTVIASGAHQIMMKNRMADMDSDKASAYLRGEFGFTLSGYAATLTPGLRMEYRKLTPRNLAGYLIAVPAAAGEIKTESDAYATPSLNLAVALAPDLSVYARLNCSARLPTAAERTGTYDSFSYTGSGVGYAVLGNPNLKKETSQAFEAGLKSSPAKGMQISASVFRTEYKNFIDYVAQAPDPVNYPTITRGLYRPQNNGSARTWGGEASLRAELGTWSAPLAGYSIAAAAGVSHGKAHDSSTGKEGELASTLPRKASATFAYDAPNDAYGVSLSAVATAGKQPASDTVGDVSTRRLRIAGATVADLAAYWNIGKHVKLHVGIYNLGDKRYWDYATSRSLAAGVDAATLADIERQARPGRNAAAMLTFQY